MLPNITFNRLDGSLDNLQNYSNQVLLVVNVASQCGFTSQYRELGLAQERLALEAGVDRTLVSKIERQIANPSLEILIRLALSLNISVNDLLN